MSPAQAPPYVWQCVLDKGWGSSHRAFPSVPYNIQKCYKHWDTSASGVKTMGNKAGLRRWRQQHTQCSYIILSFKECFPHHQLFVTVGLWDNFMYSEIRIFSDITSKFMVINVILYRYYFKTHNSWLSMWSCIDTISKRTIHSNFEYVSVALILQT